MPQQLADPNSLTDAGQFAQSPELWKALMALDAQRQTDQLVPPPRNPAAPADWAANAVRGAAGKLTDIVTLPGRAMQQGITTEEAVPWATDTALNMIGSGVAAPEGAIGSGIVRPARGEGTFEGPIRAYHSSPHDFEQFDPSKLRTGEGHATYGEGFYFAENPAVSGQGGQYWKNFLRRFGGSEESAARRLWASNFERDRALESAQRALENADTSRPTPYLTDLRQQVDLLKSGQPVGPRTYEVGINARPEQMLDWDKPLSQQTPEVQTGLKQVMRQRQWDEFQHANASTAMDQGFIGLDKQIASQKLDEAGIPGITYLDQGSRRTPGNSKPELQMQADWARANLERMTKEGMGEPALARMRSKIAYFEDQAQRLPDPTRNYVVFPGSANKIDIYRKYGMAGAVPAAGAAAYSQDNR